MSLKIVLPQKEAHKLALIAHSKGVPPAVLGRMWIMEELNENKTPDVELPPSTSPKCLCTPCDKEAIARGLCPRHYQRARWFMRSGKLNEAQLIRTGRMTPPPHRQVSDYALKEGEKEIFPEKLPDRGADTYWLFGRTS